MDVPTAQEKSEQIFFAKPKGHQNKFADLNKMVPTDLLKMIVSLSSVRQPAKWLAFLRRLPRTSSQRKGKWLSFLLHVAVNRATINMIDYPTIAIETIGAMIALNATTRT
jgi:hypothetical protein